MSDCRKASKSDSFIAGFESAERHFLAHETDSVIVFVNPYPPGSDESAGYQEAVYIFTQK